MVPPSHHRLSPPLVQDGVWGPGLGSEGSRHQSPHARLVRHPLQVLVQRCLEVFHGPFGHLSQVNWHWVKKLWPMDLKRLISDCFDCRSCTRYNAGNFTPSPLLPLLVCLLIMPATYLLSAFIFCSEYSTSFRMSFFTIIYFDASWQILTDFFEMLSFASFLELTKTELSILANLIFHFYIFDLKIRYLDFRLLSNLWPLWFSMFLSQLALFFLFPIP